MNKICPLCNNKNSDFYHHDSKRDYLFCSICDLVFVPFEQLPSLKVEKTKYDQHQNSPNDKGYRNFLGKLYHPMVKLLNNLNLKKGLDFGSGPGPTLSKMFEESGFEVDLYDIFYAKDESVFDKKYDFITTTEVVEHLHHPYDELLKLWSILEKGGLLGIMTAFRPHHNKFDLWYYKNDPTHVRFFTIKTFRFLSSVLNAKIVFTDDAVVIFRK